MNIENDNDSKIKLFKELSLKAELGGGKERIEKQVKSGKYTARQRINHLLDPGSFCEFDKFVIHNNTRFGLDKVKLLGDGVITGIGKINGLDICVYSQDFTCIGGALGGAHAKKICKIMDFALDNKMPIIGISDSGGARIQEGVESLAGYAEIFYRNVQLSGVVPQISLIMGPCAGGAVYSPAITDFVFMVEKTSYMFVTGPEVVKTVTHEIISKEDLGGAKTHNEKSGVAHFACFNEDECFERVRELLSFVSCKKHKQKSSDFCFDDKERKTTKIDGLIPSNIKKPYDIKEIIFEMIDNQHFLEIHSEFAKNIVCGFAKIGGASVGIVANQPLHLAGTVDIDSSVKAARFIRFCDAFNLPIITLVDVPGFLPGVVQEYGGIIKHGAKLLYAYAEATVPLITLITRKAYGGAYDVMASKHLRADINLSYPFAEIAVMGAEGAVNIIFRKHLKGLTGTKLEEKKNELIEKYQKEFNNPYRASELGYIDEIILPEQTREKICHYLKILENKNVDRPKRKHGNIPL